jgi:SAM-dependent methyltransferase
MPSPESLDPTGRFSGLAEGYAKHRPSYPAAAIDCLIMECKLAPASTVVDVGCGTGISTRLLAARGLNLIGIEPNADMLASARNTPSAGDSGPIEYRQAPAEATGLASGIASAITSFQAFHWFDRERALKEFHRVLVPGGWLALMWNDRDNSDLLTSAYHQILSSTVEGRTITGSWRKSSEILFHTPWFKPPHTFTFTADQVLDQEGLVGRALSASYAPRQPEQRNKLIADLRELHARAQKDGVVRMRYQVNLFLSQSIPQS